LQSTICFLSFNTFVYFKYCFYLNSLGISREVVFSSFTLFIDFRVAMLRAQLCFGILEVEKTSPGSIPFTALMRVVKRKEVESFFTLCKNVSKGKQDGIRLT
jgi:hypothetical protein